jgi:hypothetical protein
LQSIGHHKSKRRTHRGWQCKLLLRQKISYRLPTHSQGRQLSPTELKLESHPKVQCIRFDIAAKVADIAPRLRGGPGDNKPRLSRRGKFGRKGEGAMICPRPHAAYRDSPLVSNARDEHSAGPRCADGGMAALNYITAMCGRATYKLTWEEIVALYRRPLGQPAVNTRTRRNLILKPEADVLRRLPAIHFTSVAGSSHARLAIDCGHFANAAAPARNDPCPWHGHFCHEHQQRHDVTSLRFRGVPPPCCVRPSWCFLIVGRRMSANTNMVLTAASATRQ